MVRQELIGDVAVLSLDRPARHNALVPELLGELLEALDSAAVRGAAALVLRAEGRSFSTGGDLLGFHEHRASLPDYAALLVGMLNQAILAIYRLEAPSVCAVQGPVSGGSLGFLLACDRVVMQRDVTVRPWYGTVGFSPDGGWTALLPDLIGSRLTAQWLDSDVERDAASCLEIGLAHELVAQDPTAAAMAWTRDVVALSRDSQRVPSTLRKVDADLVAGRLEAERTAFVRQVQTTEALQGIERFLGRKPQ